MCPPSDAARAATRVAATLAIAAAVSPACVDSEATPTPSADAGALVCTDAGSATPGSPNGWLAGGSGAVCTGAVSPDGGIVVLVDGASPGRTFDSVGGLSGGGGTSRLLYDYPPQQRSEVLDFLFKPGFGASLQLLKVEIGSDTDTTNGAEATHERTPGDRNFKRGYEWWLMTEAKLRNPAIKLYGLEWGAPGWFGTFFSQANINYIVDWIQGAKSNYGLDIDYVGGRNEGGSSGPWFEDLKSALAQHCLGTQVVAADDSNGWKIATTLNGDAAFNAAVDVIGTHYVCGYQSDGSQCGAAAALSDAIANGKPLWASEEGSLPFDTGAVPMARAYNRHYIQAKVTASINWSLVGSWYTNLPYGGVDGLLYANQPWSGSYAVDKAIWVTAHTTQFVQPGWQYLDSGSAVVPGVGSYVALRSPNGLDWSVVLETTDAPTQASFAFVETGGLLQGPVHVWATDLSAGDTSGWFVPQPDIVPSDCGFAFTAQPNTVYTFTTTSGQGKGATTPPPRASMALPYEDAFEGYSVGAMPNIPAYFSTVQGAFEVEPCAGGRSGQCLQQEVSAAPIGWSNVAVLDPVTIVGDPTWTDYRVTVDVLLQEAGSVDVIGRISGQSEQGGGVEGYHLQLADTGAWSLFSQNASATATTLSSGSVAATIGVWHTLSLDFQGTTITATLDGASLASVTDATYLQGNAGLSTSKWNNAQFDDVRLSPL